VSGYDFRWATLAPLRLPDGVISTVCSLLRHYRTHTCLQWPRRIQLPEWSSDYLSQRGFGAYSTARVSRCWGAEQPWHAALEGELVQGAMHGRGQGRHRDGRLDATSEVMHSATGGPTGCAGSRRNVQTVTAIIPKPTMGFIAMRMSYAWGWWWDADGTDALVDDSLRQAKPMRRR
jgi:hypothetical protein